MATMKQKWFEFGQNNSGGSFHVDEKVCHKLFIEAPSSDAACDIAESLGCYWHGVAEGRDCSCCGDRWSKPWSDDGKEFPLNECDENFASIEEYAQDFSDKYGTWTSPAVRAYFANGEVKEFFNNPKPKGATDGKA